MNIKKQFKILCSVDGFRIVNRTMYVLLQSFIIVIFIIMITSNIMVDVVKVHYTSLCYFVLLN